MRKLGSKVPSFDVDSTYFIVFANMYFKKKKFNNINSKQITILTGLRFDFMKLFHVFPLTLLS